MNDGITEVDLGWLAGFYEGEGSVHWYDAVPGQRGGNLRLTFTQSDPEPLQRVRRIVCMKGGLSETVSNAKALMFSGEEAMAIANLILPLLSTRRQRQLREAMQSYESRPRRGQAVKARNAQLIQEGKRGPLAHSAGWRQRKKELARERARRIWGGSHE